MAGLARSKRGRGGGARHGAPQAVGPFLAYERSVGGGDETVRGWFRGGGDWRRSECLM